MLPRRPGATCAERQLTGAVPKLGQELPCAHAQCLAGLSCAPAMRCSQLLQLPGERGADRSSAGGPLEQTGASGGTAGCIQIWDVRVGRQRPQYGLAGNALDAPSLRWGRTRVQPPGPAG